MVLVALTAGVVAACLPDHAALPAAPGPANRAADGTTRPANAAKGLPPVLLVTENNYFLERALNALEGEPAGGPPRLTPAEYEKQCQGGGPKVWEKYAVILFDGYAPHEEPRCHGVMYVNVIGPGLSLKQARDPAREPAGGADNAPRRFLHEVKLKQPAGSHPLARTLAQERAKLDNVFAPSAMALELGPDWQTVLDGSDGPMLVAWHRPNAPPPAKAPATQPAPAPQARLVLAFSLMESNWPLKASFPLFLDESIRWLADGSAD